MILKRLVGLGLTAAATVVSGPDDIGLIATISLAAGSQSALIGPSSSLERPVKHHHFLHADSFEIYADGYS